MKSRNIIILFLYALILWFTFSNIAFNLYVSCERDNLLKKLDSQSPIGKFYSSTSIKDKMKDFTSNIHKVEFVGMNSNREFVYKLPEWLWTISYFDRVNKSYISWGRLQPRLVISKTQIYSQEEMIEILDQVYNQELDSLNGFENDSRNTFTSTPYELTKRSSFYFIYSPSSKYVHVGNYKVLIENEGGERELVYDTKKITPVRNKFYIIGGVVFAILFFFKLMQKNSKYQITKQNQKSVIIVLCLLFVVVGSLFFSHSISEKNKEEKRNLAIYESKAMFAFPLLESISRTVTNIKKLELDYIKHYYNPYSPEKSIRDASDAFCKQNPGLIGELMTIKYQKMSFIAAGQDYFLPCYKDNERLFRSYSNYEKIKWSMHELLKKDMLDISSEIEMKEYVSKSDSLIKKLDSLESEFINDNRQLLCE